MSALQESRRELMVQLEGLMRLLKVNQSSMFQLGAWKCNCTSALSQKAVFEALEAFLMKCEAE